MAPTLFYHHVRVQIGVENPLVLQALRSTLYHLGCRDIAFTGSMKELREAIAASEIDLLIVATELSDSIYGTISQIRHGELGTNPFLPVVGVTVHPTHESVQAAVDCGVDDLLPYPWTMGYLDLRLEQLIAARRPFVVTSDYIGPDRRAALRPGHQPVQPIGVPNPLRAKALDRKSNEDLAREIKTTAAILNADKIRRLAELVVRLINELEHRAEEGDAMSSLAEACLNKMLTATASILKRADGTAYAPAATTCRNVQRIAQKMRDDMEMGDAPDPGVLRPLANRFIKEFQVDPAVASIGLPEHLLNRLPTLNLREDVA
ncbi:MAG: hypothetical protein WCZ23_12680 [Rhodospirillaceae bacterium]